jgi:hypothetical protein
MTLKGQSNNFLYLLFIMNVLYLSPFRYTRNLPTVHSGELLCDYSPHCRELLSVVLAKTHLVTTPNIIYSEESLPTVGAPF